MSEKYTNIKQVKTNTLSVGMNKDLDPQYLKENQYTHAVNAKLNNHDGKISFIQNEPSTIECYEFEKDFLSAYPTKKDHLVVYLGEGDESEIGTFNTKTCTYTKVVSSPCLNFNKKFPPKSIYQEISSCGEVIYIVDNYNPNRYLTLNDIPYIEIETGDCEENEKTTELDCNRILLKKPISVPCLDIEVSKAGGKLTNSQNQVAIAYAEKGVRVTDIYSVTQGVSIFSHQNLGGGVEVTISNVDRDYGQYFLYLLQTTSNTISSNLGSAGGVTSVYRFGPYPIEQNKVHLANTNDIPVIPIEQVLLQSIVYEKSKDIVTVDDRALWIGATTKPRFNYQPLANQITTKWTAKTVSENYYREGGVDKGYMRDEVYSFAIQWLNSQGQWSEAFHIPGRVANTNDLREVSNLDNYELYSETCEADDRRKNWQIYNTSTGSVNLASQDKCDNVVIGSGRMSYWESKDIYPNNKEVYDELACEPIRHHKMPDICKVPYRNRSGNRIILGVKFESIPHPIDCEGNPIENIVGYRIVRGDRTNHKSIQAKGLFFNTGEYELPNNNEKILYPNYPFNDLRDDPFLTKEIIKNRRKENRWVPATTFNRDIFTFHSPDTEGFNQRFTFGTDIHIEGEYTGKAETFFSETHRHPKNVILTDFGLLLAIAFGIFTGVKQAQENDDSVIEQITNVARLIFGDASAIVDLLQDRIGNLVEVPFYTFVNADLALQTIQNFSRPHNFVLQANSLGNYEAISCPTRGNVRRQLEDIQYLYPGAARFQGQQVNNRFRESSVILKLNRSIQDTQTTDTSRETLETSNACDTKTYRSTIASHYGSIRRKLDSQYGQIDQIEYLDTGFCNTSINKSNYYNTNEVFGGDVFLTEYTLKRKMQYFTQSPMLADDIADNYEFDYSQYPNLPFPRYWMDTFRYEATKLIELDFDGRINLPSKQNNLDCSALTDGDGSFTVGDIKNFFNSVLTKDGDQYMYLSNNGVSSFIVESTINLDLRDWDDREGRRHYDKFQHTDLDYIFRQDFKDIDNDSLYNQAYSQELTQNFILTQNRDFTCANEECFTEIPNRVFYSLQYQEGSQVDNWRNYLANNFYDFPKEAGDLLAVKPLDRNNIAFLFNDSAPWLITAQDTLQTEAGMKITIGDGGLFAQRPRPIVVTDTKYGSISHNSLTHTQYGLFYPSANQGRIYSLNGSKLDEINVHGMKWWLRENMDFKIESFYPDITSKIPNKLGYRSVFDNKDETYYLTKIDYIPLSEDIVFDEETCEFTKEDKIVTLDNKECFSSCSWTLSYVPNMKAFVSFHDWHPDFTIQTEDTPLTVKNNIIYKHNETCEHYCYYYDTQYTFDIEYVINNGQTTSTLSNIEYSLEAYKYFNNCKDSHHLLDYNFNRAFIYNTEQTTGKLHLNLASKNDITKVCYYPRVRDDYIDIEFSKVEQKYRFNQFWDVTKNRAEFNDNYISILSTECNCYKYCPNPEYIDYNKPIYQRKKLRHNWHKVYLSREDKDKEMNKIIVKFLNNKNIISPR